MSQQKKRMKMLQLRREVEQMMLDRRQKHAEEMQLAIKLDEQEAEEMEKRLVGVVFVISDGPNQMISITGLSVFKLC